MPSKKQTRAEKIAQIPIEEISKLSGKEGEKQQKKYLRELLMGYRRRVASFKRKGLFSYAQEAYEGWNGIDRNIKVDKLTRNQRILEIAKLQHFFNAKTSNEKGIKEVNLEQDKRIFGVDKRGRPKQRMDEVTRRLYWKLYDEYLNQFPTRFAQSETVQQILASAIFPIIPLSNVPGDEEVDNNFSILEVLQKVEDIMKNNEIINNGGPNAYMGRGPTID